MIGVAAAEVAFKNYVAAIVPDAEWLVEELPAAPLDKMLRHYLPQLRKRQTGQAERPLPSSLLNMLDKGVRQRNKVAHSSARAPDNEFVLEVLRAVEDFLWILDSYLGFPGALAFVSYDLRKQL